MSRGFAGRPGSRRPAGESLLGIGRISGRGGPCRSNLDRFPVSSGENAPDGRVAVWSVVLGGEERALGGLVVEVATVAPAPAPRRVPRVIGAVVRRRRGRRRQTKVGTTPWAAGNAVTWAR